MLPDKIGPARKLALLVDGLKARHIASGSHKQGQAADVPASANEQESQASKPELHVELDANDSSDRNGTRSDEKAETCHIDKKGCASLPSVSNHYQMGQNIPKYSSVIMTLLEKGQVLQEWDKFIEETAYHLLSLPVKFETKDAYQDLGRALYTKYPCIGFSTGSTPWKLSQKLRNIRWKWNRRSEKGTEPQEKRKKAPRQFVDIEHMQKEDNQADATEAYQKMEAELKKTEKDQNKPLILKLLQQTFKQRRAFIQSLTDGNVKTITDKYSALMSACYLEREFFLIKPELSKSVISDRWKDMLHKLDKVFRVEEGDESSDYQKDETKVEEIFKLLQQKIRFISKSASKEADLITMVDLRDVNLSVKKKTPPRLIIVKSVDKKISSCYIVADGLQVDCGGDFQNAVQLLLMSYYIIDLTYPKCYQLLGFLQKALLKDESTFFKSSNFTKFEKVYLEQ